MPRLQLILFCLCALLLAACSSTADSAGSGPTPTPLPTSTAPQFPVVAAQVCQLARYDALRTRQPQGDLIAWAPDQDRLAYVGPAANSNWFSGTLHLVSGPDFAASADLAPDVLIFGDLSWSPDGARLAYVTFHQPDTYSAAVSLPESGAPQDLFANSDPRTDAWGSSKAIQSWRSPTVIRVLSSCGEDCDQTYEIDLQSLQVTSVGEQLRKAKDRFWPHPNEREYDATIFPVMWQENWETRLSPQMKRPTWTTDGAKVAYIDRSITAWVLRADRKEQYMLDTPFIDVQELKWSSNGRYLALRTDDDVYVYDTECEP
jgi:hypothetical protein